MPPMIARLNLADAVAAPRLLVIDTATETLAVAACGPAGEATWSGPGGAAASAQLLPAAMAMLAQAGLQGGALDAIAFGAGPGAFTGLRTACAVAQGLAFGLGCPVLPLDNLAVVAEDSSWHDGAPLWVAIDARMEEVYAAAYRRQADAGWAIVRSPALFTLEALAARWTAEPPQRVAGNALAAFGARLPDGGAQRHDARRGSPRGAAAPGTRRLVARRGGRPGARAAGLSARQGGADERRAR